MPTPFIPGQDPIREKKRREEKETSKFSICPNPSPLF
jgi:hypothetical protein